jgi:putative transposase
MGRAPRIEVRGGTYHVGARGNRGCRIYDDDLSRTVFLQLVARIAKRYSWACHAYCLMSNHYHLLVRIGAGGLSDGMRELNGEFARFSNVREGRDGHLFRNRFWSELIEDDVQMLETCRYIVLNPIRAQLCPRPEDWRWSSHRACAGLDFAAEFLAVDELLRLFGSSARAARRAYRTFVHDGLTSDAGRGRCQTP